MSFCEKIKNEIIHNEPKSTCCRKAFCQGLLLDADYQKDGRVETELFGDNIADFAKNMIEKQYHTEVLTTCIQKPGRTYHRLSFCSKKLCEKFLAPSEKENNIFEFFDFKCPSCIKNFLKGVFISIGTITVKGGENHIEYKIKNENREPLLTKFLTKYISEPKKANRQTKIGLYYKNAETVDDNLRFMELSKAIYSVANNRIETDIKAFEIRKVNCETSNISRAIDASQNVIKAIKYLQKANIFVSLDEDLQETATLRLENPEMSLNELASIHKNPISKSGISHRLEKIIILYEKAKNK